ATGSDQGVALETLLAGGPLHDLVDVREVGVADDEVLTERLADAHHGHLLPHVLSALSGGTVGGLVEPAQATLDDLRRTEPVEAGARGEAGALTAGEHDVLHRGRGGGVLGRLGHVAAGAGDRHADLTAGAALGGCGHGVACALVVLLVLGVLVLVVVLLVLVVVGAELAVGVLGLGGIVLVGVGGQLLLGGVLVGGADLRGQLGGAVGALTSGLLADTSLGLNGLDALGEGGEGVHVVVGEVGAVAVEAVEGVDGAVVERVQILVAERGEVLGELQVVGLVTVRIGVRAETVGLEGGADEHLVLLVINGS